MTTTIAATKKTRPCCGTTYDTKHSAKCPERGVDALQALACDPTSDGWCAAHSTGAGPAYCGEAQA